MKKLHWFFKVWILIFLILLIWYGVISLLTKSLPTKVVTGEIRGIVFQNQIWRGEINVTGDLVSLPNVQINIEKGTKVLISKNGDKNNFDLLPWHLRTGINTGSEYHEILNGEPFWDEKEKIFLSISNLYAIGNDTDPIVITSTDNGSPYDVNLIRIQNGEISNVYFSNYRRLEIGPNVLVSDSLFINSGECSICISKGNPLVKGNTFKKNKRNYLDIEASSPLVTDNTFLEGEGDGILFKLSLTNQVRVLNNTFQIPNKKAIKIESINQQGYISGNNFILGDMQLPCNSNIIIINNLIRGNILFFALGGCNGEYTFLENYWEILDPESILNARISGTSDKFKVNIPRIFKNPPKRI